MRTTIFDRAVILAVGVLVGAIVNVQLVSAKDAELPPRMDKARFLAADPATRANVLHAMDGERRAVASALIAIGGDTTRTDGERSWAVLGLRGLTLDQSALGFCVEHAELELDVSPEIGGVAPVADMERPCVATLKAYASAGTPQILARATRIRDAGTAGAVAHALVDAWGEPTAKAIVATKLAEAPSDRDRAALQGLLDAFDAK